MVPHPRTPLRVDRLRALNLPRAAEVRTDGDGLPVAARFLSAQPGNSSRPPSEAEGWKPVETIVEIWRMDDEWWRKPVSRLYVETVLEGGKRVLLYRDLVTGEWFVQNP